MTALPDPTRTATTGRASATAIRASLLRYRAIAYIVGVGLIVLVCIGMPVKYIGGSDTIVAAVGPIHGVLYMVYLAASFDLANRCRLSSTRTILIMLAGTIPFLSFFAERRVTFLVRESQLSAAAAPVGPATGPTKSAKPA
ncbi:hypothetical protein ThrDRAFT_01604 [Frankia casuarinae]|jgi:integral membrane protein|uniref:DUF3817 domain-containing protein n=1 Tax=Frankia casuarinae (strain DSM 45818 / CECT 9043 / HFP020203 / CcI3) TaxID=106370 RepID=Q2J4W9_FRACC|nr:MULTISPECIES: DUF3817 domain-containing protein [Frankia]ABD13673.1 hypothetical protein Francci3_4327 [Frankia casuarinae]ETA02631.1 hypothetical protein CcI6DRAFT_02020 [Frankia sp. CcI6]EYT92826.1 hypothetical protein ThrDRAFT_01604 [Frankia casuarinae]KDA43216.1 hypothetical protein BMG523Draft_01902 [Frankia sp. BMG5.23]ORT96103.1 hypothetical protein UK99_10455 [Frankia casuarinae]